ncbi:MAG: glycosyltransferase family 2 protein [Patescibacteria group bacterium]
MKLSIVILNYKMKGLVKNCLRAIFESIDLPEMEILVIDNASNDGIEEMLKEEFPTVKFIQTGSNLGMGGGTNVGIKNAMGEYVLILNPDILISPDSIKIMLEYLENNADVGLLAPKLLNPDGTLQYTCYRWHNFLTPFCRRTFFGTFAFGKKELARFLMHDFDHETVSEVDWLQGSCLLARKEVWEKVNYFSEEYFMYFEDTDLCRKIKNNNLKVIYFPATSVIHFHRRQSAGSLWKMLFNKLSWIHLRSWLKYEIKWRKLTLLI